VCRLAIGGRPTRSAAVVAQVAATAPNARVTSAPREHHAGGSRVGRDVDAWESGDEGGASGQAGVEKWPSAPRRSPRTTRDGREIERDGASPPRARGGIRARSRTRSVDRSSACVAAARSPIASAGTVASCVLATGAARVSKRGKQSRPARFRNRWVLAFCGTFNHRAFSLVKRR
jgi:hypothetical protein